jgi:hypothetical protein
MTTILGGAAGAVAAAEANITLRVASGRRKRRDGFMGEKWKAGGYGFRAWIVRR